MLTLHPNLSVTFVEWKVSEFVLSRRVAMEMRII